MRRAEHLVVAALGMLALLGCAPEPVDYWALVDTDNGTDHDTGADAGIELGRFAWAKHLAAKGNVFASSVAVSKDGAGFVAGYFERQGTFGKGEANETVLQSAGQQDIFIAKVGPDSALAWAVRAGGPSEDRCNGISAFADGSLVLVGYFEETAVFGPGEANETVLTSVGHRDMFLARYAGDGSLLWARSVPSKGSSETASDVDVHEDGTFSVTGTFHSTTKFGDGEANETVLTSAGYFDAFVARYASKGTLIWARSAGGEDVDQGNRVDGFDDGSVLVTQGITRFNAFGKAEVNEAAHRRDSIFVVKYRPNGETAWTRIMGETTWEYTDINAQAGGAALITGNFNIKETFGHGETNETVLYSAGGIDLFAARLWPDGTLDWVTSAGGFLSSDQSRASAAAQDGSLFVVGSMSNQATFGQGEVNETHLESKGGASIFVAKYNPDGTLAWAEATGGEGGSDQGEVIAAFEDGTALIIGTCSDTTVFNPGKANEITLESSGMSSICIAKVNP